MQSVSLALRMVMDATAWLVAPLIWSTVIANCEVRQRATPVSVPTVVAGAGTSFPGTELRRPSLGAECPEQADAKTATSTRPSFHIGGGIPARCPPATDCGGNVSLQAMFHSKRR